MDLMDGNVVWGLNLDNNLRRTGRRLLEGNFGKYHPCGLVLNHRGRGRNGDVAPSERD